METLSYCQLMQRCGELETLIAGQAKRIAELEARTTTVKLPQRYSMLHRTGFDEPYHTEMVYIEQELVDALAAAGITLDVGE